MAALTAFLEAMLCEAIDEEVASHKDR